MNEEESQQHKRVRLKDVLGASQLTHSQPLPNTLITSDFKGSLTLPVPPVEAIEHKILPPLQLPRRMTATIPPEDTSKVRTALLVVDVQKDYWSNNPNIQAAFPDFEEKIRGLLCLCRDPRSSISLIVHVRAVYGAEHGSQHLPYFQTLSPEKRARARNDPEDFALLEHGNGRKEIIVEKPSFDAFHQTGLERILRAEGIEQTFVCGMVTSACVHATAASSFHRGFKPVMVEDCLAERSRETHEAVLRVYGGYMYKLSTLEDLKTQMLGSQSRS